MVSSDESSGDENDNDTDTDIDDNGTNGVQVGEKRPPPLSTLSALRISCSHAATASKHWRPTKDVFVDISAPLALQLRSGLDPVRAAPLLQTVRADIAAIFCWDLIGATRSTGAGGPAPFVVFQFSSTSALSSLQYIALFPEVDDDKLMLAELLGKIEAGAYPADISRRIHAMSAQEATVFLEGWPADSYPRASPHAAPLPQQQRLGKRLARASMSVPRLMEVPAATTGRCGKYACCYM